MDQRRILMLPYAYQVDGVLKGKKKPQIHNVIDVVPVEIHDLTSDEASIAFRAPFEVYRRYDGTLLMSMREPGRNSYEKGRDIPDFDHLTAALEGYVARALEGATRWQDFPIVLPCVEGRISVSRFEDLSFRSVSSNNQDERRTQAIDAARSGLVLVDGVPWARTVEPVLGAGLQGYGESSRAKLRLLRHCASAGHFDQVFAIDELDQAKDWIERVQPDPAMVDHELPDDFDDSFDPSGWAFDGVAFNTRKSARHLMEQLSNLAHHVIWMSPEFFRAVVDFRDLDLDSVEPAALARSLVALSDGARASTHPNGRGFAGTVVRLVDAIEWRWRRAGRSMEDATAVQCLEELSTLEISMP